MAKKALRDKTDVKELTEAELEELKEDYEKYEAYTSAKTKIAVGVAAALGVCLLVLIVIWLTVAKDSFENERNLILMVALSGVMFLACVAVCVAYGVQGKKRKAFLTAFGLKYSNALISSYCWNYVYTYEERQSAARMASAKWGGGTSSYSASTSGSASSPGYSAPARQPKTVLNGGSYYVNSFNEIIAASSGYRTAYKVIGNSICLVSDSRTIGWMHPGGAVNYANDYSGEKPFVSWEKQ